MTEGNSSSGGYGGFLTARVIVGIIIAIAALWGVSVLSDWLGKDDKGSHRPTREVHDALRDLDQTDQMDIGHIADDDSLPMDDFPLDDDMPDMHASGADNLHMDTGPDTEPDMGKSHGGGHAESPDDQFPLGHAVSKDHSATPEAALLHDPGARHEPKAVGVHFVEATVAALDYELNERFWGWRRNDLIRFTDNVENMQLGILEVVRRTCVVLTERISRHGVSAAIDHNLENSMNWLMIKPDRYWLPSAEEKYGDSLKELKEYGHKLEKGEASFYVRADNLIPLLLSYADLAGSCDENLVKSVEDDGSPVSWFKTDDYFYYSRGVAKAMGKILHAVREDFSSVLEARQGVDLLNRAIHACHVAADLDPWIVTDASLEGILANHRANMAAEISHLRYFLNALAKALST